MPDTIPNFGGDDFDRIRRSNAAWTAPDMSLAEREAHPAPAWPQDLFPGGWGGFIATAAEGRG